jgi:hypothetical protein
LASSASQGLETKPDIFTHRLDSHLPFTPGDCSRKIVAPDSRYWRMGRELPEWNRTRDTLRVWNQLTCQLYLLCGKVAAGKSALAQRLAARSEALLISEDHWTSHLYADDLKTMDDYGRYSARLRAAMGPHIIDILRQGLSIVLDFPANTVRNRNWMRSLIDESGRPTSFTYSTFPIRSASSGCGNEMRVANIRSR